jgi:metal-responsive CopG/Arc/MetJ family transcriptional regulator
MTTTIEITLQSDLLDFVERYAKQLNRQRDEIIADAIRLLHSDWELEQGYRDGREETLQFAETAIPLFAEVLNEDSKAR